MIIDFVLTLNTESTSRFKIVDPDMNLSTLLLYQ